MNFNLLMKVSYWETAILLFRMVLLCCLSITTMLFSLSREIKEDCDFLFDSLTNGHL